MENSASTLESITNLDLVTGRYRDMIQPLSPTEYAELVLGAVELLKPQLAYLSGFFLLGNNGVERDNKNWTALARSALDNTFDISIPVYRICDIQLGGSTHVSFYLNRHGQLRIITDATRYDGVHASDKIRVIWAEKPEDLLPYFRLHSSDVELLESERLYPDSYAPPIAGQWVLKGLERMVQRSEETIARHLKKVRSAREALSLWHSLALSATKPH